MNGDFENQGLDTRKKIFIGIGAGILVLAILVGGFLFIRSRASSVEERHPDGGIASTAPENPSAGSGGAASPESAPGTIQRAVEADIQEYLRNNPPVPVKVTPPVEPDVEHVMSLEEKKLYGLEGIEGEVRYKFVLSDPADSNSGYTLFVTSMPPTPSDTDGDGILDFDEPKYGTDLNNPDSDGDGLSDGFEVEVTKTDPTKSDTNGDGKPDASPPKLKR